MKKILPLLGLLSLICLSGFAQKDLHIKIIPDAPQAWSFPRYDQNPIVNMNPGYPKTSSDSESWEMKVERGRKQMEEIEKDMQKHKEFQQRNQRDIDDAIRDFKRVNLTVNYDFPTHNDAAGAEPFLKAYEEFRKMLKGEQPLSINKGVFLSESPFIKNLTFERFNSDIKTITKLCYLNAKQRGYNINNPLVRLMSIYDYMTDTVSIKLSSGENQTFTHYPMTYDFDDYRGDRNWTKMFVAKLLDANTGQCHNLPLFFLCVAEEMQTKAYLSFSPNHSFIKFKDPYGNIHNFETTNGYITSDATVIKFGHVKSEAISNRIYLDTLNRRQIVANSLVDLAKGYQKVYGNDKFVLKCLNLALENHPQNVFALMMKTNYAAELFAYVHYQLGRPEKFEQLPPAALELYKQAKSMDDNLLSFGYEDMPKEAYEQWLQSMEKEKKKQGNTSYIKLKSIIK